MMKKKVDTTLFPLFLIFSIPIALMGILYIYHWIAWDVFGNTKGMNSYYLHFGSMWKATLWIFKEMGVLGTMCLLLSIVLGAFVVIHTIRMGITLIIYGEYYEYND